VAHQSPVVLDDPILTGDGQEKETKNETARVNRCLKDRLKTEKEKVDTHHSERDWCSFKALAGRMGDFFK
jgi:hypothetical protein